MKNDDERKIEKSNENIENKIFHNNKFCYKKFEKFVDKSKSFIFLEIDIKNAINEDNCTEDNLALIKAFKDAAESREKIISIFISIAAFCISLVTFLNDSYQNPNVNDGFDIISCIGFILIIAAIIMLPIYLIYYGFSRKGERLQFAYSYLINMLEVRLKDLHKSDKQKSSMKIFIL